MDKEKLKKLLINAFFPERCELCGKVIYPYLQICDECENGSFYIRNEICHFCGVEKEYCVCKKKKNSYSGICAPFYYEGGAKKAILNLKFRKKTQYAKNLAGYMAECVEKNYPDVSFDYITFVPMTKRQIKERGFNQSELFAEGLYDLLLVPVKSCLVKVFETKQQHTLKESLRKGNVLGAFDVDKSVDLEGKTILLCDDIQTTGSTLNECAKMLKLAGAKEVYCVTAAITKKRVDKKQ
ncbi:MAG: ComF family protein [Ruminococcaceae bacterium]|nr:ComF family protein [Oscillospiraceae bacterium]